MFIIMVKNKNNNKKCNNVTTIAIIGTLIMLISGFFLSYNYVQKKKIFAFDYMSQLINPILIEEPTVEEQQEDSIIDDILEEETVEKIKEETNYYEYLGYLEIPKINLKKGFVDKTSSDNNVDKNIFIVNVSDYPDVEKGNFIIAAHSGTGYKAFFRNLYQLNKGDDAFVTYNGVRYHYQITKIYKQEKTGKIAIYRDYNKTTMTLVTCSKNDDLHQDVYILELMDKTST